VRSDVAERSQEAQGLDFIMSLTVSKFNRKAKRRRGNGQRDEMERVGGDGRKVREMKWKG